MIYDFLLILFAKPTPTILGSDINSLGTGRGLEDFVFVRGG